MTDLEKLTALACDVHSFCYTLAGGPEAWVALGDEGRKLVREKVLSVLASSLQLADETIGRLFSGQAQGLLDLDKLTKTLDGKLN